MAQIVSDVTDVLDYQKDKKEVKSQRKQLIAQMAKDEQNKTNLIKKTLAVQRAKYGASGMSGRGMTEEAVLRRLKDEVATPYDEKRATNLAKLKSLKATKKTNLLKSITSRFDELFA